MLWFFALTDERWLVPDYFSDPEEIERQQGTIAEQARKFFSEEDLVFGRMYMRQKKIKLVHSSGKESVFSVDTRTRRTATLRLDGAKLFISCDCPYGRSRGRCGHAWAMILDASARGMLFASPLMAVEKDDPASVAALVNRPGAGGEAGAGAREEKAPAADPRTKGNAPHTEDPFDFVDDDVDDGSEEDEFALAPQDRGKKTGTLIEMLDKMFGERRRAILEARSSLLNKKNEPAWRRAMNEMLRIGRQTAAESGFPGSMCAGYTINVQSSRSAGRIDVEVALSKRLKSGNWGKGKLLALPRDESSLSCLGSEDRAIVESLTSGGETAFSPLGYGGYYRSAIFPLREADMDRLLPMMCSTRRLWIKSSNRSGDVLGPLEIDGGPAWEFGVRMSRKEKEYVVEGVFERGAEVMDAREPLMVTESGWLFTGSHVARAAFSGAFQFAVIFRERERLVVPPDSGAEFADSLLSLPTPPRMILPPEFSVSVERIAPRPKLHVNAPGASHQGKHLEAAVSFLYGAAETPSYPAGSSFFDRGARRLVARDRKAENAALERVAGFGLRMNDYMPGAFEVPVKSLSEIVRTLATEGWLVEADGKVVRSPGKFSFGVKSGVDWFDLEGGVDYGDTTAPLPALLDALKKGEGTIVLADGTLGILPEDWLKSWALLAGLGKRDGDSLRFSRSQAGLLDALLAGKPDATVDEAFERARTEIRRFEGVEPAEPPKGFKGQLRDYQKEGLGWFRFLDRFGFGGCLADDMGLGKTVQALALLEGRREAAADAGTRRQFLVVAPKSLMFNWRAEAVRFTPGLKVIEHTGPGRATAPDGLAGFDLILTTYGTLRRDAAWLSTIRFDWAILDEAQAIKNAGTASAKAARLLEADHRLALSGTPVENRLSELWSLFEFLNPGILGSAPAFDGLASAQDVLQVGTREALKRVLRPFILRRTKSQVAKELPQRTEQTIHCELEGEQRDLYDELLGHYRRALLGKVESEGLGKSKLLVIEALLRLRQAACHPGLIDKKRIGEPSAKVDALIARLAELHEGGHKALVFSQFTSFLSIVRSRLDDAEVSYEYLDGKTKDRAQRVERFQTDPLCSLFLISLKAGGLGLNLTAAEYVFLLDPWWNPAVEAQAIDRTHRIGQTKKVFAYRLIARNTVEEKIIDLQRTKRDLADAIVGGDEGLIRGLTRRDIEMLLS